MQNSGVNRLLAVELVNMHVETNQHQQPQARVSSTFIMLQLTNGKLKHVSL